jgi:hypothetical protein
MIRPNWFRRRSGIAVKARRTMSSGVSTPSSDKKAQSSSKRSPSGLASGPNATASQRTSPRVSQSAPGPVSATCSALPKAAFAFRASARTERHPAWEA